MPQRRKPCEPLGTVFYLRTVRDQITHFQERRGIAPEENNFFNVMAVMVTQGGQAMYAVFTMFLALLPAATIFLHVAHFMLDRLLDITTTRTRKDLLIKGTIFLTQVIILYFGLKFIMASVFIPIFMMQTSIFYKMFMLESGHSGCCG